MTIRTLKAGAVVEFDFCANIVRIYSSLNKLVANEPISQEVLNPEDDWRSAIWWEVNSLAEYNCLSQRYTEVQPEGCVRIELISRGY